MAFNANNLTDEEIKIKLGNIPVSDIAPTQSINLGKPATDNTDFSGTINGVGNSLASDLNFLTGKVEKGEEALAQGQNDMSKLFRGISLEGSELLAEEDKQGVTKETEKFNQLQQTLLDLQGQASSLNREAQAIPLQTGTEFKNTLATKEGVQGVTTERLRDNALKALSIAQQSDIAFAAATGSQIRLNAAKEKAQQIIDLKYAPLKAELEIRKQQYTFNKDILERIDKKRAEALGIALKKEEQELADKKANDKAIQDIGVQLSSFGIDPSIIKDAQTPMEAIQIAGKKLQDPKAKLELQKLKLDIQQKQREIDYFKTYGKLTPEQYNKKIEAEKKAIEKGKEDAILLDNSINQIETVLNSSALNSVVGSNIFSRGVIRQKGFISKGISAITSLGTSGTVAEITGKADDTVALTQQMLDQQFLDKLIDVKSKGATFGALSDNEGQALRNAANAIAGTAIKTGSAEKGNLKVIGYDMSESEFKKQMTIIQDSMRRARQRATGQMFSTDEQQALDDVFGVDTAIEADYSIYFNQ